MLDTVITLMETGEFEDLGSLRFSSIRETREGLMLGITVLPGDGTKEQRWSILCSSVREYRLQDKFADKVRVVSEHPVLLPFAEDVTDLYSRAPR